MRSARRPQRSCVGCRRRFDQDELVRIRFSPESGTLVIGRYGVGRSAYVCADPACREALFAKGRLERALRRTVPKDLKDKLRQEL